MSNPQADELGESLLKIQKEQIISLMREGLVYQKELIALLKEKISRLEGR